MFSSVLLAMYNTSILYNYVLIFKDKERLDFLNWLLGECNLCGQSSVELNM
jgi:hypothetical protein